MDLEKIKIGDSVMFINDKLEKYKSFILKINIGSIANKDTGQ